MSVPNKLTVNQVSELWAFIEDLTLQFDQLAAILSTGEVPDIAWELVAGEIFGSADVLLSNIKSGRIK